MLPRQFLVNKNGEKMKIVDLSQNGAIVALEKDLVGFDGDKKIYNIEWLTWDQLGARGWSLLEEPWRPMLAEPYWYVDEDGNFGKTNWGKVGTEEHDFRYSIGNVHQNLSEAKLYKQKLIERMGKK